VRGPFPKSVAVPRAFNRGDVQQEQMGLDEEATGGFNESQKIAAETNSIKCNNLLLVVLSCN
jgi:hypothetical protein